MRQYQPALVGFDRSATVADLDQLPRIHGAREMRVVFPVEKIIRARR
ncbi:hypothetical protein GGD55_004463 [Rhizobium giardinii]|uniref:Uncharacterized protein n=1 Tax=Rhizobium giardinii TaxID=56731 RepID=A0A7W8UEG0_9HYPH|nr:hypothetical protein [Rhizobium giardinii]